MIIETKNGKRFDTDRDLTAPERHILQKLFAWEAMSESVLQFREKKKKALEDETGRVRQATATVREAMIQVLTDQPRTAVMATRPMGGAGGRRRM